MDAEHEDQFVVFVREHRGHGSPAEVVEQPVLSCATYGEACRARQALQHPARECIIRFVGQAGGGD